MLYLLQELQAVGKGDRVLVESYVASFELSKLLKVFAELLWCLDHHHTEVSRAILSLLFCVVNQVSAVQEAVRLLVNQQEELMQWQHDFIVHSLLKQGFKSYKSRL